MIESYLPQPEVIICVDSTNRLLAQRALAEDIPAYTSVVARHQRTGRGRLGRSWYAPTDSSLLFSTLVVVPSSIPVDELGWVPLGAALAVAMLVEQELPLVAPEVGIKWPNDLFIGEKKVGGILSEFLNTEDGFHRIVVGVGLNLEQTEDDLSPFNATSLAANGWEHSVTELSLIRLADELNRLLSAQFEDFQQIPSNYAAACLTLGQQVRVTQPNGEFLLGLATNLSPLGGLVVAHGDQTVIVTAGEVTLSRDPHFDGEGSLSTTCEECH